MKPNPEHLLPRQRPTPPRCARRSGIGYRGPEEDADADLEDEIPATSTEGW